MNGQATMAMNPVPGGPVGGPQIKAQQQVGGPANNMTMEGIQTRLNTYIYDHLLRNKQYELARQFKETNLCRLLNAKSNGISMGMNSKDGIKRPDDLQDADLPPHSGDNSFLLDWFSMFWDTYNAAKHGAVVRPAAVDYVAQQRMRSEMASRDPKLLSMNLQQRMVANGMKMGMNNRPQPMTEMQMQQRKMMTQNMQRDPSNMDMTGGRPLTPGGPIDNAPSPSKKPRLDNGNGFESQGLGAGGRPIGNPMLQNGMTDAQLNAFGPTGQPKLEGMNGMQPGQLGQGMDSMEFIQNARMTQGNAAGDGRHALQDYQMQLMLLEQQNKKRLLQARREQDHITNHMQGPGPGQGGAGTNQIYAPNMSPSGSRGAGPSPNPADQMKRGTPKISQAGLPGSPMPEMQQRASPGAPNYDPSNGAMHQGMPQQYFTQMGGIRQPPSSHPQFPMNMNPQQIEQMNRMAQANGGRLPNGQPWQPGAQNPGMQPGLVNQPNLAGMGTPQSRGNMAPPPAPTDAQPAAQQRAQESSPAQPPAPPTPSQTNKGNPKKKEPAKKKNAPKKQNSTTAATPTETAEPTTSAPATPMTPMQSFNKAGGQLTANQTQAPPAAQVTQPAMDINAANPSLFGLNTLGDEPEFTLDFTQGGNNSSNVDVLDGFDFESFLQTDDAQPFNLAGLDFDTGVETGAGPV